MESSASVGFVSGGFAASKLAAGVPADCEIYQDSQKGFKMFRPSGWNEFGSSESFDVKWQDIIVPLEQITVVTTPVAKGKSIKDIGSPEEIGQKLSQSRRMDLIKTSSRDAAGILIYNVELKNDSLHSLVVLTVAKSKLYTVNIACPENRWGKREKLYSAVAGSFIPRL